MLQNMHFNFQNYPCILCGIHFIILNEMNPRTKYLIEDLVCMLMYMFYESIKNIEIAMIIHIICSAIWISCSVRKDLINIALLSRVGII